MSSVNIVRRFESSLVCLHGFIIRITLSRRRVKLKRTAGRRRSQDALPQTRITNTGLAAGHKEAKDGLVAGSSMHMDDRLGFSAIEVNDD